MEETSAQWFVVVDCNEKRLNVGASRLTSQYHENNIHIDTWNIRASCSAISIKHEINSTIIFHFRQLVEMNEKILTDINDFIVSCIELHK